MAANVLLDAALQWAADGIPVFPVRGKEPLTAHGFKDATVDEGQIRAWWTETPDAGIGGATGEVCGCWVLDVDGEAGKATLAELEAHHGALPPTRVVRTGGGGLHYWWRMPDVPVGNRTNLPAPHRDRDNPSKLDVRGTGGYVVLPPSPHPAGTRYELLDDEGVAEAPAWLVELVVRKRRASTPPSSRDANQGPSAVDGLWGAGLGGGPPRARARVLGMLRTAIERIRAAPEGSRNDTVVRECFSLGGFLDAADVAVDEIAPELEAAAVAADQPKEAVRRSLEDGRAKPRPLPDHDPPPPPPGGAGRAARAARKRPEIVLGPRVDLNVVEVLDALSRLPDVFQRHGNLERVAHGHAAPLTASSLITQMSRAADFYAYRKSGKGDPRLVAVAPPGPLARSIVDAHWHAPVRELAGVTTSPVLRPDGSIVASPGYDPDTKLYYAPNGPLPLIPGRLDREHAVAAVAVLLDVVDEVPFAREADRAAWLALVLTLAVRNAIEGNTPFFASIANQARTGKTRLVQYAGLIALGMWVGTTRWPSGRDEEELGKRVDAAVLNQLPLVLWDNIRGAISGTALESAITTPVYTPRILGKSQMLTVEQRTVFAASANGAQLAGDMAERTLPIRLHFEGPNPAARTFRRPNLVAHIEAHRTELHAAALTIASAYLQAGAPDQKLTPWGSYEGWGPLIRGALVWAGQPDPCDARDGIGTMDLSGSTHDRLIAFIAAVMSSWRSEWTTGDLADVMRPGDTRSDHDLGGGWTSRDARDLAAELGAWDRVARDIDRRRLGSELRTRLDRPAQNGARITYALGRDGKPRRHRTGVPIYTIKC